MKNEKHLSYLGWIIFVFIGLLQMYKVSGGFITNYGADSIAPVMLYYATRTNKTLLSKLSKKGLNEQRTFILLLSLCIAWEILQRYDLSGTVLDITRGTFDYWDILTYTLTLSICYYFDVTRVKRNLNTETAN